MATCLKRYSLLLVIFAGLFRSTVFGQQNNHSTPFPPLYDRLTSDTARMRYLVKAIADSLNEGRLHCVYDFAEQGLMLAERSHTDTMIGIFDFDIGKAFAYHIGKPDSAIVYFKKVLPYFPNQLGYYNLISVREIMERYLQLGNKDSTFAYLDALHERIDTTSLTNPRRYDISSVMAGVYQYYGMFRTAIALYENSIEGLRKAGHQHDVGVPMANLAELYDESEDDTNAVRYAREALGYLAGINMAYMGTAANLSTYYTNLNHPDSALYFNKQADSVGRLIGNDAQVHFRGPMNDIDILCSEKKYAEAKEKLDLVKPWLYANLDQQSQVKFLMSVADIDTGLHRWPAANDTLQHALSISRESGQEISIVLALQQLVAVNANLNNFHQAYLYQQQYMAHKDSLTNDETKSRLADFEAVYRTRQKEEQIQLLQRDNDIQHLQLKNSRQKNVLYLIGFLFLLAVSGVVFYGRNRRLKIEAEKIKAESQMQVLRSQMNPHFIFNCLNSIEYFIMQNDRRQASGYLHKFSTLIRNILDSSRDDMVPLMKDMETLNLYVEMEQLRFNQKFIFNSYVDPALQGGEYRVPPLLIQPFVENAIVNGLANSDEQQLSLTVTVSLQDNTIRYVIQDNGVGREKARVYSLQNRPYHKSVGLKITEDRINRYNRTTQTNESITITDLYDEEMHPGGTRVEVALKAV